MYIKIGASTGLRGKSSSDMFGKIILVLSVLAWTDAQIPNLGFCPEYIPMANFNLQRVSNLIISLFNLCVLLYTLFFVCGMFNIMHTYRIYFNRFQLSNVREIKFSLALQNICVTDI